MADKLFQYQETARPLEPSLTTEPPFDWNRPTNTPNTVRRQPVAVWFTQNILPLPNPADPVNVSMWYRPTEQPSRRPRSNALYPTGPIHPTVIVPPTPPGPIIGDAAVYPVVVRVPDSVAEPDRLRRATEQLSAVFNSLAGKGFIRLDGVSSWTMLPGGFAQPRNPAANDDITAGAFPLMLWINTATGDVFVNTSNAEGAAVWRQIG